MGCAACGAENPVGAKFCAECGVRQPRRCPSCNHDVGATAKFCLECGERLEAGPKPGPAPSAPIAPQSYTPRHLAEKILASRHALVGERKQVTVLFTDLVGSTELIRDLDPEIAQHLLDGAVTRMMDAIHRYEGTVCRLLGDGLMALFGAPIAHEDHGLRACYAALALQSSMRTYAAEVRREHGLGIEARVGLNSGEVIVRLISDDLHMDYTAMGQTVHLASRMEQAAKPGGIALTPDTLALTRDHVETRSLGPLMIKGLSSPMEGFELFGIGPRRTRLQAAALRGLTQFVGRQSELLSILTVLDRAANGHGQVVALVGEPGIGKSRLTWEVTHARRMHAWLVLETGAVPHGRETSYVPVIDLLKAHCRIDPHDDLQTIRAKVTGRILALDTALASTLPALLALLGVSSEDGVWEALEPTQRRRQILDALRHVFLRLSRAQPLLLVFEDLHWIDAETQTLLDELVESLPTARIVLLVTYRPEYVHRWGNKSSYTQIRIDSLLATSVDELLTTMLGSDPSLTSVKKLLSTRTEGNPLFLEESVRDLVEHGALIGVQGERQLAHAIETVRVPVTIQAVLAARIDRLPSMAKQILQTAAVIGRDVPHTLLQVIADVPPADLQSALAYLRGAELLYEASVFPELEYTFKHALTHDVAYDSLLLDRRRALHGQIVAAIERLYADRLVEHVEQLAYHAFRGERWEEATMYSQRAGQEAIARAAYRAAVGHFEQALEALRHLPESRASREAAADSGVRLYEALQTLGEIPRGRECLREAQASAETLGDAPRLGRILADISNAFYCLAEHELALEAGMRALAIGEAAQNQSVMALARHHLAHAFRSRGDYRRAVDAATGTVGFLRGEGADFPDRYIVAARAELAVSLAELGRFQEAIANVEEARRVAEAIDHPWQVAFAATQGGTALLLHGSVSEAIASLEHSLELCKIFDLRGMSIGTAARLGEAYTLAGRAGEALPLVGESIVRASEFGRIGESSLRFAALGAAELATNELDKAAEHAKHALDFAVQHGERGYEAWALRLCGEISACTHSIDDGAAEEQYRRALASAKELEMRPLQAHCHLGLGKLYHCANRLDEARAELATAVAMLREMGMSLWLPEAEQRLAQVVASFASA